MCGLTGFWEPGCVRFEPIIFAMTNRLRHRGPDGAGYWHDGRCGVALGHRRLAILDLSDRGRQPMFSPDGRYAIVYNGEVYNFAALRAEVEAARGESYPFVGGSDTEVILAAVCTFGLEQALQKLVGMYAFALWDRRTERLHLVRDRLGIKPLYWSLSGGAFVFGSELKALTAHPRVEERVDRHSLAQYLRYSTVPAPRTIYEHVQKVAPGEVITVTSPEAGGIRRWRYWTAEEAVKRGRQNPFAGSEEEAIDRLEEVLLEAVKMRMVADVPLGAFLSGGVDSSTIAALMQSVSDRPIKTFSIGMKSERYDEAGDAEEVADYLGTEHTSLVIDPDDALKVIPRLSQMYCEPFSDSSQLPTFLVSELARKEVTVALSGDGGDELFGGYNRHFWGARVQAMTNYVPGPLRRSMAKAARLLSPAAWDELFDAMHPFLPEAARVRTAGDKVHKMAALLHAADDEELYRYLTSQWKDPARVVRRARDLPMRFGNEPELESIAERWMYRDLVGYLPDDILTKVDRASMAVSLEARVPFLDHRVVEFAWQLDEGLKIRNGQGKWLLRQVLYRHVPREMVERPKMGFGIPLDEWLRGALKGWAEELLDPLRLEKEGFFDHEPIQAMWEEHQRGISNRAYPLWNVLVFQDWWQSQQSGAHTEEVALEPVYLENRGAAQ